jgi:hypothetical protein
MTMTPATQALPNSALELLVGPADGAAGLKVLLSADSSGDLGRALEDLPAKIREIAASDVSKTAAGLLQDIDLVALLVKGWREYADLTSAGRRTLAAPGSSELVSVVTHQVTAEQEPHVDLLVDGHLMATVRFGVSVDFEVSALVAGVSAGLLVAVHAGRCDITGTLAINGVDVVTKQAHGELPGAIPLTPGIRLLPAKDYAAAKAAAKRQGRTQPKTPAGTRTAAVPGTADSAVSSATRAVTNEETNSAR